MLCEAIARLSCGKAKGTGGLVNGTGPQAQPYVGWVTYLVLALLGVARWAERVVDGDIGDVVGVGEVGEGVGDGGEGDDASGGLEGGHNDDGGGVLGGDYWSTSLLIN